MSQLPSTTRVLNSYVVMRRSDTTYFQAKNVDNRHQAAREALKGPVGSFAGWIVSGSQWESFNLEGAVVLPPSLYNSWKHGKQREQLYSQTISTM